MAVVILSPHFDDAVLSCWQLLTQPGEVEVINVFAGAPASLDGPAWWDCYTGAADSEQRVRERVDEDREALALAGRTAVNLEFLDEQYRTAGQPLAPVKAQLERLLAPGSRIYAPAAFGNHPDHALARASALALRTAGFEVWLYADLPHATRHGWPSWVTSERVPAAHDLASATWERTLAQTGIRPQEMTPTVHRLDRAAHARKMKAVRAYRTQFEGLAEFAGGKLDDRSLLGYEVSWALPGQATEHESSASRHAGLRR